MRVAVIYGSRLGATRGIAERIAARLGSSGLDVQIEAAERVGDLPAATLTSSAAASTASTG